MSGRAASGVVPGGRTGTRRAHGGRPVST